jgi:hypothetical protein
VAVPAPPDWSTPETITEAKLDSISTVINYLLAPPRCYTYRASDGALAHATWDPINFANEAYDSHAAHDNSTNNTRLVIPESGLYTITAHATFDVNATGQRAMNVRKNAAGVQTSGTDIIFVVIAGNGTTEARPIAVVDQQLVAGDYLELFVWQSSGGPLDVVGGIANTFLSFRWVAKTV